MAQQNVNPKVSENGLHNPENSLPTSVKQPPVVAVKKTPLRDVQNEKRMVMPNSNVGSPCMKDGGPATYASKVSGIKRPPASLIPSQDQSPSSTSPNAHLVYVRRKSEAETGKNSVCEDMSTSTTNNSPCQRQVDGKLEGDNQSQIKKPKVSSFPAFAPLPATSFTSPPAKPTIPVPVGKSGMMLPPPESNHQSAASTSPSSLNKPKEFKKLHWEERYYQLQMLLKDLDQSNQEEYVQMLISLSSVELSRHAVELEKRSIQLSLEEAKEMHRVALLNVLGKPTMNLKALSSTQQGQP